VVEATSGNTGISLAAVAAEMGYRAILFMPEHMSPERVRMIRALGAEVRLTSREGSFAGAVAERDRYRGRPGFYVPDQFGNPDNTRCHRTTTGPEIVRQLREQGAAPPDAFVAGVGTGGTLMGVGLALREVFPGLRIVPVEPAESNVMCGKPAGEHGIQGIGDGFIPDLVDMKQVDEVEAVSTDEAHGEARRIHTEHGYCVGMSSGANLVAARRLLERGLSVVTVWADCSDRYGSMGLHAPESEESRCPLHQRCGARMADLGAE
jgi:cysteine synthase A